ncbi:MBL fold metallo-hydrolase [Microbacterium sp. MPKO10]|uniref:MBL fold metallo-hydrolase n=1 Tax=Microbacterium sp. MPKO10 TaxID=2989818 RepID=UPI00223588AF|nr:MBL fold metallo-hydrolase [Microbacterium sp. MPKO10]MCW4459298.1 MBL fold metallo-hydrolase [Microbacterium sp. MPKO10]
MNLTKLEHAAFVIDNDGERLIVDPGAFTTPITDAAGTVAVVITHEHPDHWTPEQLQRIRSINPNVRIFGPAGVARAAEGFDVTVVEAGDEVDVEPFSLRFFGGKHAVIHPSIPIVDNLGVLIDGAVYYGGDSFTVPEGVEVDLMAVPAGAPWLKISEVMDFVAEVAPKRSFPTHEMVLSRVGKDMSNQRIASVVESGGGEHFPLEPGESIEV